MKRFISAVSSLVIAATAMGGTFAMSTTAASDIQTLIEFTTTVDGKRTSEITAKAGQTIPVKVYIPQSGGVNTVSLKLAINGDATLGQGTVQYPDASDPWYKTDLGSVASEKAKAGTVAPNPYLFGNYGITMTNLKYGSPYCFDSGSFYDDGWGSAAMAGNYKAAGTVPLNADGWSIGWKHEDAISNKENIDAYGAWVAAGKPETSDPDADVPTLIYDRVGASTWTSSVSWAYDYTFVEFDLVLPNDLKDGTYKLDNYAENYVNSLSLFNISKNDPTVAAPVWTNSSVKGVDGSNYKTTPLTITVGDIQEETTTQPKETTTQPRETTSEPKETTTSTENTTKAQTPDGIITYNMIPQNKEYTAADQSKDGTFNIVDATAGEKITMALTVANDLGTSGMQFYFKVDDGITIGRRTTGNAYAVTVKWNTTDYAYVWSTDDGTEATAADGAVLSTFALTMPSANGTYKIQLDTSKENMVRPAGRADEVPDHKYYFHGIQFNVGSVPDDTTTAPKETTTEPKETTTQAQTPDGIIIYNMIPQNKDYTAADQSKDRTFNVVEVTPGEKVTMALNVTNDLGTSGMQLYFKVDDGITVGRRTTGDAYQVTVKWNTTDYAYVWSTDDGTEATAADGAVLSTFALTMPATEGTYSIDLDDSKENMVRPAGRADEVPDHKFNFHGIQFVVKDVTETTTEPKETTTEPKETTTEPKETSTIGTTTTEKQIPEGDVFWGDTNEDKDVRIADVVMLNKFIAGKTNVSDQGQKNADCQHDGELNSQDAAAIKAYLAQLIPYEKLGTANPLEGVKTN